MPGIQHRSCAMLILCQSLLSGAAVLVDIDLSVLTLTAWLVIEPQSMHRTAGLHQIGPSAQAHIIFSYLTGNVRTWVRNCVQFPYFVL